MRYADHAMFFNSIVKHLCINPDDYKLLKRMGVSSSLFPSSKAKSLMVEFEKLADQNKPALAQMKIHAALELETMDREFTKELIASEFTPYSEYGRAIELAHAIHKDPFKARQMALDFTKNISVAHDVVRLADRIEPITRAQAELIKNGKYEIIVPGFEKLSKMVGGLNPGRVFIITAKTGVGKTNLALNIARKAIDAFPILFINMEMLADDLVQRVIHAGSLISRNDWSNFKFIQNEGEARATEFYNSVAKNQNLKIPFLITNGKSMTVDEITTLIIQQNEKYKLGLVIIDYDQKIRTSARSEQWQEIHRAVEEIEEVAKFCGLPVILLAQANEFGHPKSSARIEQCATAVLHFHAHQQDNEPTKYLLEAIKNRNGIYGACLEINYKPEMSLCIEADYYSKKPIIKERTYGHA